MLRRWPRTHGDRPYHHFPNRFFSGRPGLLADIPVNTPATLFEEGKVPGLWVSDKKLFVVIGEREIQRKSGNNSWICHLHNQFGATSMVLGPKGTPGTLRT